MTRLACYAHARVIMFAQSVIYLAVFSTVTAAQSGLPNADSARVMRFKDGKSAAFSLQFDDSMETQADFAIPEMNQRGLVGTFFINPDSDRYRRRRQTWEVVCVERGHELANHTLRHKGAADYVEAEREIGGSAHHIWKLQPVGSRLRPFLRGGGTTWGISREQIRELMVKYYLFRAPRRTSISDESENNRPVVQARRALEQGRWGLVGFHGIGGQWISTGEAAFIDLLDFLAENEDQIWTGTTGDVFRYTQERDAVKAISVDELSNDSFTIAIECDPEKVETYGRPFTELYDVPLTVRMSAPETWRRFTVQQTDRSATYTVSERDGQHHLQFDVRPNVAAARVAAAD